VLHDVMPHDPIQGQGHRGPKVAKMVDFNVYLLHQLCMLSKTNGELWYSQDNI